MSGAKGKAENCWEYWGCPENVRSACDAYTGNLGKKCYLVAPDLCSRRGTSFEFCWQCPWCQKVASEFCRRANKRLSNAPIKEGVGAGPGKKDFEETQPDEN